MQALTNGNPIAVMNNEFADLAANARRVWLLTT
jgi:hypothetical protein